MADNVNIQVNGIDLPLPKGANPAEGINASNSPILFGCRTGVCGTCLVNVLKGKENISPITEDEDEMLEVLAKGNNNARLACQFQVNGDIEVEYLGKP